MHRHRNVLIAAPALVLLAGVPQAAAATRVVDAGVPSADHSTFWGRGSNVNAYFPSRLTIRVGDTVSFRPSGYHSVHLLGRRGGAPTGTLVPPRPPVRVAGETDAAGTPFWFNGLAALNNIAAVQRSRFGKTITFTGAHGILSGFRTKGVGRPMRVRFARAGTFRFVCDYHAGMRGTIKVVRRPQAVTSAASAAAEVRQAKLAALKVAATLPKVVPPPQVIRVGSAGAGGVEYYDFVPKNSTVPVGSTVRFEISPGSRETHAPATGPGDPELAPSSYLGLISRGFEVVRASPLAVYPSDPPQVVADLTPASHGNGFWSAGVLDRAPRTSFPASRSVRFPVAGTYVFVCLVHKYMRTSVTVR